jgi:acyl transferase domain-containing protein
MMDGVLTPSTCGTWMLRTATSTEYWVRRVRSAVKFSAGLSMLTSETPRVLVEIGPGEALCRLARQTVTHSTIEIGRVVDAPHARRLT